MAADPLSLIGQTLDKVFRVDALVGEGGFGVVYRGFHLDFEQPVALKCLKIPGDFPGDMREAFLRKFREEGRLQFQLSQGAIGIVRSIALGDTITPSGVWTPYVVLEWLDGQPLSEDLDKRRKQGLRGRTLAETMALLEMPARALAYAHERRVAHRDIKPANLFILPPQRTSTTPIVKILDFGIAKVMAEGANAARANATMMGFSSFTPDYAAPEQFDPKFGSTGPWSDVYSFAIVAVEMLTDRPVTDSTEPIELLRTAIDQARRPTPRTRGAEVPDAVEAVFRTALAVAPTDRYPDMNAFWESWISAARLATAAVLPAIPASLGQPIPTPASLSAVPSVGQVPSAGQHKLPATAIQAPQAMAMAAPMVNPMPPPASAMPVMQPYPPMQQAWPPSQPPPMYPMPSPQSYPMVQPPPPSDSNIAIWLPILILGIIIVLVILGGALCVCSMALA